MKKTKTLIFVSTLLVSHFLFCMRPQKKQSRKKRTPKPQTPHKKKRPYHHQKFTQDLHLQYIESRDVVAIYYASDFKKISERKRRAKCNDPIASDPLPIIEYPACEYTITDPILAEKRNSTRAKTRKITKTEKALNLLAQAFFK